MDFVAIGLVALFASALTLYSGFGLGTLLMPVFALFFPVEAAIGATAIVHGANNLLKVSLLGEHADRGVVLRFGVPAIVAAVIGAWLLGAISHLGGEIRYTLVSAPAVITPVKLSIAILMLVFAFFELLPRWKNVTFDRKYLIAGGLLSGFFGGFSGHQGALRSAFLAKTGLSTEAFVGTNAVIGLLVDLIRILVYTAVFSLSGTDSPIQPVQAPLILCGILAAFAGVLVGRHFLHAVTMSFIQTLTGILLLLIALALGTGLI